MTFHLLTDQLQALARRALNSEYAALETRKDYAKQTQREKTRAKNMCVIFKKWNAEAVLLKLSSLRDQLDCSRYAEMFRTVRNRFDAWNNKISDESVEATRDVSEKRVHAKLPWYFGGGFLVFWGLLFFAVVIPLFYRLPTPLTMEDASKNVFITERAYKNLYTLSNIGVKLAGSPENEIKAVNFIVGELESIKSVMLTDYFDMEIDVSNVSGAFPYSTILNMYQGVQNIAVKLTPKNSASETYLLVNSHFDSKPATNSAGDAGFMIVTMLETLRVIATTKQNIEHPIVFLFNGAEEGALQASHGFITQHRWVPYIKAVVNLDAAGSGGRDVLFQSGPKHPWLVNYYQKYAKHPFATTLAEEIFQSGILPSDTDFRQFNIYGNIPGLDMAQCINGFVYHTKYDLIDVIPRGSLQNTGDNVLSIVRGLANATELHDTAAYKSGNVVFFDFLGMYFFHYTEATGKSLNFGVAGAALILVFVSMWRMAAVSEVSTCHVFRWFILVLVIQIISFVLSLALPAVVAYGMDAIGLSLTYYSVPLLVIGLYVCPSLIGLSLPTAIYYFFQRNDKISTPYHVQLSLHAQAIIISVLVIGVQYLGFRSAYIFMIPLAFYVLSLAFNLLTTLHDRGYSFSGLVKLSQVIPFLYSSYVIYVFIVVMTPMGGRAGSGSNRDLYIAILAAVASVLCFGFLIPLINTFRRPSMVIFALIATAALSFYLASSTQLGFPYRPKTSGQRVSYLQVRNMFYEFDGTLSKDESGYLFNYQDRRAERPFAGTRVNQTGLVSINSNCQKYMMCGMPLYDYRYVANRMSSKWLPRDEPVVPPSLTTLELLNKTIVNATTCRFDFQVTGPSHMSFFIQTEEDVVVSDWSFLKSHLTTAQPYHIWFTYGIDSSPLKFYLEITKADGDFDVPSFQLGISGHYISSPGDADAVKFAASFPSYSILAQWPALYLRYIF